jgi:hypothetical protein
MHAWCAHVQGADSLLGCGSETRLDGWLSPPDCHMLLWCCLAQAGTPVLVSAPTPLLLSVCVWGSPWKGLLHCLSTDQTAVVISSAFGIGAASHVTAHGMHMACRPAWVMALSLSTRLCCGWVGPVAPSSVIATGGCRSFGSTMQQPCMLSHNLCIRESAAAAATAAAALCYAGRQQSLLAQTAASKQLRTVCSTACLCLC